MQNAAVREDPGSFREDKREGETAKKQFLSKTPQSGKIREVSGKRNGKEKRPRNCFFQNTAIREDPGRIREVKREGRNRLSENPQSGKFREDSGKVSGKVWEH